MPNISESPNGASACSLSRTLEVGALPRRYYLSQKACAGILRRASRREKELPDALRKALERVAGPVDYSAPDTEEPEEMEGQEPPAEEAGGQMDLLGL